MASLSVSQDKSMEDDDNRIEWVERDFYKVLVNSKRIVYICPAPPHFLYTKDRQGRFVCCTTANFFRPFKPIHLYTATKIDQCIAKPDHEDEQHSHNTRGNPPKMQLGQTNFGWNWITLCQMGYPRGSRLELKKTDNLHRPDTVGRGCSQETEIQSYPLPWDHPNNHRIFHNRLHPEFRRISI